MKKKRVLAASLSLHFYIHDGWKKEDFDSFVVSGKMNFDGRDEGASYYRPDLYNFVFNLEKLLERIYIVNLFDKGMSDADIVKQRHDVV